MDKNYPKIIIITIENRYTAPKINSEITKKLCYSKNRSRVSNGFLYSTENPFIFVKTLKQKKSKVKIFMVFCFNVVLIGFFVDFSSFSFEC